MNISRAITGAMLAAAISAGAGALHAEAAALPVCKLKAAVDRFSEARMEGSAAAELAARKELLMISSDCSKEEAQEALRMLAEVQIEDKELIATRERLAERLKESMAYAESQKARVGEVGMRGTKDVARSLKEWRTTYHLVATGNVVNLSLWKKNQDLIGIAENRSRQINHTLAALRLADREGVKATKEEAERKLRESKEANETAKRLLIQISRPEEVAGRLRDSLNSLSEAYSQFFKISEEVENILPL